MRARATQNGPADGWRGARIGAERRHEARRAAARIHAEIDLGDPPLPLVTCTFLVLTIAATLWQFATFGAFAHGDELARAGGSGLGAVATGEWWKLVTANFLHLNPPHVLLNAFFAFMVGRWLEPLVGRVVVTAVVLWAIVLTSAGALLLQPGSVSAGASGVGFALMGCAVAADPRARTAAGTIARQLLVANLVLTFVIPGISIGGHLGGLLAGLLIGGACWSRRASQEAPAGQPHRVLTVLAVALAVPVIAVLAIGPDVLPGHGRALRSSVVEPRLERHVERDFGVGDRKIDHARCTATSDPTRYACAITVDGTQLDQLARFHRGTDEVTLSGP